MCQGLILLYILIKLYPRHKFIQYLRTIYNKNNEKRVLNL